MAPKKKDKAHDSGNSPTFVLRLYITGSTPNSINAIRNIKEICEKHLQGNYSLEVIDLYKNPEMAEKDQIIAIPTLLKRLPEPLRKIIGDLSNHEKVLKGLDIIENV